MRSVLMQGFNLTAMHEIVNFDKEYTRFFVFNEFGMELTDHQFYLETCLELNFLSHMSRCCFS